MKKVFFIFTLCCNLFSLSNQYSELKEIKPFLDHGWFFFEQFLSNVIHQKQEDKIIPIRMDSYNASFFLDKKADLIYIDASHDEKNVFLDIYLYYPKLKEGGIMCGDDWAWGSVRNPVRKFAKANNLEIIFDNFFWYYKPKKGES